jgi:hypothetical protein
MLIVMDIRRRSVLISPVVLALAGCVRGSDHPALPATPDPHPPNPMETLVLPYSDIKFEAWGNLPPQSGEMATLYGDLNKPGPYLVMMKWNPGWFSAPHSYATDRICVVVSGTWWVNSGHQFRPHDAEPGRPRRLRQAHR